MLKTKCKSTRFSLKNTHIDADGKKPCKAVQGISDQKCDKICTSILNQDIRENEEQFQLTVSEEQIAFEERLNRDQRKLSQRIKRVSYNVDKRPSGSSNSTVSGKNLDDAAGYNRANRFGRYGARPLKMDDYNTTDNVWSQSSYKNRSGGSGQNDVRTSQSNGGNETDINLNGTGDLGRDGGTDQEESDLSDKENLSSEAHPDENFEAMLKEILPVCTDSFEKVIREDFMQQKNVKSVSSESLKRGLRSKTKVVQEEEKTSAHYEESSKVAGETLLLEAEPTEVKEEATALYKKSSKMAELALLLKEVLKKVEEEASALYEESSKVAGQALLVEKEQKEVKEEEIILKESQKPLEASHKKTSKKRPLQPPKPKKIARQTVVQKAEFKPATEARVELETKVEGKDNVEVEVLYPIGSKIFSTASLSALKTLRPISKLNLAEEYAERLKTMMGKLSSCECVPGLCKCPGEHYIFTKEYEKRLRQRTGIIETERAVKEIFEQFLDPEDRSSSCMCFHEPDSVHHVTPASSLDEYDKKSKSSTKIVPCPGERNEKTLVIIKPPAVKFRDVVFRAIKRSGLDIIDRRVIKLTAEQVSEVYKKYYGKAEFPNVIETMSNKVIIVFTISGDEALNRWNRMIGPANTLPAEWFFPPSMLQKFGLQEDLNDVLHGSEDVYTAQNEIRYFFPNTILEPIMTSRPNVEDYCNKYINPTLSQGLVALVRAKPEDPLIFLAEWLLYHNPYQPEFPPQVSNVC